MAYLSGGVGSVPLIWQMPISNAVLMARDSEGRAAFSNPFDVIPSADLSLYSFLASTPRVGRNIEWILQLYNSGPAAATGVMLTNFMPPGMTFVSAAVPEGASCTNDNGVVRCDLGSIPGGGTRYINIVGTVPFEGSYTNVAVIRATEPDTLPGNNAHVLPIAVYPPKWRLGMASTSTPFTPRRIRPVRTSRSW
jgi:uncharacterized repeat protein (TIGR01451 family)